VPPLIRNPGSTPGEYMKTKPRLSLFLVGTENLALTSIELEKFYESTLGP